MRLQDVLDILCRLAPEGFAEPWDKVGLQLGDPGQSVRRALLCIDLTAPVLAEAVAGKVDLIVAYHPLVFQPLEALTTRNPRERIVLAAAKAGLAVYSPHTALDSAAGGVNDWLARGLGAGEVQPIRPAASGETCGYKLVVFVPAAAADNLREALAAAGAGRIGDYEQCSFAVAGEGTFRGGPASNPTIGQASRFERAAELRMEMICPGRRLPEVVAALRSAHPYEEPAFDLFRLEPAPPPADADSAPGQGRVVSLDRPVSTATLVERVKKLLGVGRVQVATPLPAARRRIRRVGLCAGAGGSLLDDAGEIDAFITGEMRHHDILAAQSRGTTVILAGHSQTERPYLKVYRRRIVDAGGQDVDWRVSRADRPPLALK